MEVIWSLKLPMERDQRGINLRVTSHSKRDHPPSQGYIHDQISLQKLIHLAELASMLTQPKHLHLLRGEQLKNLAWLSGSNKCREHPTLGCT